MATVTYRGGLANPCLAQACYNVYDMGDGLSRSNSTLS
jgi:hypothetical protein